MVTQVPTRAKASNGVLVPVNTTLVKTHGRWAAKAANANVSLRSASALKSPAAVHKAVPSAAALLPTPTPVATSRSVAGLAHASAASSTAMPTATASPTPTATPTPAPSPVPIAGAGSTSDVADLRLPGAGNIEMGFGAALPAPTVAGSTATYALTTTSSLTTSVLDDGFSEDVMLGSAPVVAPSYSFPLDLAGGLTPRLKNGVLQFVDSAGTVQAESRPLQMWDASRDSAGDPDHFGTVEAKLVQVGGAWVLQVTPSMSYLTDAATQFPVTVDPTVVTTSDADTYYSNGGTVDHGADYALYIGTQDSGTTVDRAYMNWDTGPWVGRVVTAASLSLYQYDANSCSAKTNTLYPTTSYSDVNSANVTVNTASEWSESPSSNTGGGSCPTEPNGYVTWDVTHIIDGWTTGEVPQYGVEIRAGSETDDSYFKRFCSRNAAPSGTGHCEGTSGMPQLSITYVYALGQQPHQGAVLSHRLDDRSQYAVNTQDGDGVLTASDISMEGRGLNLGLTRSYNSLSPTTGVLGKGWSFSGGGDVYLYREDNNRWDFVSPSGTWYGPFVRKSSNSSQFWAPSFGGLNADMKDNGDGTFTMTFHASQEKYTFSQLNCSSCNKYLTTDTDRHSNTITYGYTGAQWTSITDTHTRVLNVNYGSNGLVSSISEGSLSGGGSYTSSPRTWTYGYNASNQLASYIDPTGARTDYGYDSNGQLATITDPAQTNGNRPMTTLTVQNGQIAQIDYSTNATGATSRWTYAYSTDASAAQTACGTDHAWTAYTTVTDVSDPQGGATKYCYEDRTGNPSPTTPEGADSNAQQMRVVDGVGHHHSESFTPDMSALNETEQSNDGAASGSTVFAYDVNSNLTTATAPTDNSGDTAGTTSFQYSTPSLVAGGSFLPSAAGSNGSSCSSMDYSAAGDMTDVYSGQSSGSGSTCTNGTSGRHSHVDYNNDGTVKDSYGPVVGALSSRTSADETTYTYGDAYTVEPYLGLLTKVVRPGGNATCTTDRTLCTTYTYDGYGRVASSTDGNGNTTRDSYDADDRITQVLTGGATTCTPTAGTCITYTYDGEGNLATRTDVNGTTTFTYDWLNQPATQTQPDGTVLTTVYDDAGNLTSYSQALTGQTADTVTYKYDAANELTSVTDATGTFTYTYNSSGQVNVLTLPSSTGVTFTSHYTQHSGKFKGISVAGGSNLPSTSNYYTDAQKNETGKAQSDTVTVGSTSTTYNYAYNSDDRLASDTPSSGTKYSYTYDADGNIRSATAGTTTTYYGYNENDELCWSGPNDSSTAAMGQSCATTPSGDTTYTSDKAGENLGPSSGPLVYNSQDQVTSISSPSGAGPVSQGYYDQGNNLRRTAGNITYTQGSKLGVTAQTISGYSNATTFYTRDPNGKLLDEHGSSGTYYYEPDQLGSTIALIDTSGNYAAGYNYDPYGKTTTINGTSSTAAAANPWRYTGAYQDPTDGYYHLGARYYDAAGHFTQTDSIAGSLTRPDKFNSYDYAAGDPINGVDLSGKNFTNDLAGGLLGVAVGLLCEAASIGLGSFGCGVLGFAVGLAYTYALDSTEGEELDFT